MRKFKSSMTNQIKQRKTTIQKISVAIATDKIMYVARYNKRITKRNLKENEIYLDFHMTETFHGLRIHLIQGWWSIAPKQNFSISSQSPTILHLMGKLLKLCRPFQKWKTTKKLSNTQRRCTNLMFGNSKGCMQESTWIIEHINNYMQDHKVFISTCVQIKIS